VFLFLPFGLPFKAGIGRLRPSRVPFFLVTSGTGLKEMVLLWRLEYVSTLVFSSEFKMKFYSSLKIGCLFIKYASISSSSSFDNLKDSLGA